MWMSRGIVWGIAACLCCWACADQVKADQESDFGVAEIETEEAFAEPAQPAGPPAPRGVCGTVIFEASPTGPAATGGEITLTTQPDQFLGDEVNLAGTEREICEITVLVRTTLSSGSLDPRTLTMHIWSQCPASGADAALGTCGANPNASLIATTSTVWTPTAVTTYEPAVFTFNPPVLVPNTISVMLKVENIATPIRTSCCVDSVPSIGTSTDWFIRCGAGGATTTNGCNRNFTGSDIMAMEIQAVAQLGVGKCCFPDDTCQNLTGSACSVAGGAFGGEGTTCDTGCPGACCLPDGTCQSLSASACSSAGGTYFGALTDCADIEPCGGACCQLDGSCAVTTQIGCVSDGAGFQGYGTNCTTVNCATVQFCGTGFSGAPTDFQGHEPNIIATVSDLNPTFGIFRAADNFTAAADDTITAISWWGYYRQHSPALDACNPQSGDTPDDFTVTIYENLLDLPASDVPALASFSVNPTKTSTTVLVSGRLSHKYEAVLPQGVPVAANTCYWISIVNNTSGVCHWLWQTAPTSDGLSANNGNASGPFASSDQELYDLAFCLDIEILPDGCNSDIEPARACCPPPGAGGCQEVGPSTCVAMGGLIGGPDSVCTPTSCDGACCVSDGQGGFNCSITPESTCFDNGGIWNGAFSTCESQPCSGACCLFDGTCNEGVSLITCAEFPPAGGVYHGGLTCAELNCGAPLICDASTVACGGSTTVDNTALASNAAPPVQPVTQSCFGGGAAVGVGAFWVSFVGDGQDVKVSLCNSEVADTVLSVYTRADNNCAAVVDADEVACSEDVAGCGSGLLSEVCVPASVVGQTYWVLVSSFDANSAGTIQVDITCPCEDCGTCPGDVSGDNTRDGIDVQAFVDCALGLSQDCGCADLDSDNDIDEVDGALLADELVNVTGACPP